MKGYKFIQSNMKSKEGDCTWELGKWKEHKGKLELCQSGFHACKTPLQSLEYIYGDKWFIVETRGKHKNGYNKFVCSEMRLIQEINTKKVTQWFAIACARRALKYWDRKYPNDKRPLQAIEAAEEYLKNPTTENLNKVKNAESAAGAAAWSAAGAAARAAEAAWAAARAARAAAGAAEAAEAAESAESAEAAAWAAAEKKWQNKMLLKLINEVTK